MEAKDIKWCPEHGYPLPCEKCGFPLSQPGQKEIYDAGFRAGQDTERTKWVNFCKQNGITIEQAQQLNRIIPCLKSDCQVQAIEESIGTIRNPFKPEAKQYIGFESCRNLIRNAIKIRLAQFKPGQQETAAAIDLLKKAQEIIIWMSGSGDFSPEGTAYKGWLKVQKDLEAIREYLKPSKE